MNPFCANEQFELKVLELYRNSVLVPKDSIDWDNHSILSYQKTTEVITVETQKHVKLYNTPYDDRYFFKHFKPTTRDLLLYIMLKIQENEDFIVLNRKVIEEKANLSKTSYYSAIKQLKEMCIIADKEKDCYWVNPYYIFKGNRLAFYQKNYPKAVTITAKKEINK